VLRALGLPPQSSYAARRVKTRCEALGIDSSHFSGQRRWGDETLRRAAGGAGSWKQLLIALGYSDENGSARQTVRAHAARLGIDLTHLDRSNSDSPADPPAVGRERLRSAGSLIVAALLTLQGRRVSWPLEPAPFDLIADPPTSRIQVKTTTQRRGTTWVCSLTRSSYESGRRWGGRRVYDVAEIDDFAIVDGDLTVYLIPAEQVGGLCAVHLSQYHRYRIGNLPLLPPVAG
jgi:hypothetical protein